MMRDDHLTGGRRTAQEPSEIRMCSSTFGQDGWLSTTEMTLGHDA